GAVLRGETEQHLHEHLRMGGRQAPAEQLLIKDLVLARRPAEPVAKGDYRVVPRLHVLRPAEQVRQRVQLIESPKRIDADTADFRLLRFEQEDQRLAEAV